MTTLKERCEEAIRSEILKELKGKLVSGRLCGFCALNEQTGKYRVTDVEVSINDESYYDCAGYDGFDYTEIRISVITETLKAKKKRVFEYELM